MEEIELPSNVEVKYNLQRKSGETSHIETIHFLKNQEEIGRYETPIFYEKNSFTGNSVARSEKSIQGFYRVFYDNNKIQIYTLVPIEWLTASDRLFPLVLDPTLNLVPNNSSYWTGTVYDDGSTKTLQMNGTIRVGNEDLTWPSNNKYFQGWAKMNLSTIPSTACVNSANFFLYQTANNDGSGSDELKFRIGRANVDPIPAPWATVYNSIDALTTEYSRWDQFGTGCGTGCQDYNEVSNQWKTFLGGTNAKNDVQNNMTAGWYTIGIDNLIAYDNHPGGPWDNTNWIDWAGYSSTNKPYLAVEYYANNACAGAISVPVSGGSYTFSTQCATQDGPSPTCGTGVFKEIWYKFTTPSVGTLSLSTCNTASFDTRIAIFTGTCGAFTQVGCNDDGSACGTTSSLQISVTANTTYYIALGGYNNATGTGTLSVTFAAPPPPGSLIIQDLAVSATSITFQGPGNSYVCTGSVRIQKLGCGNNVLRFTGPIVVDLDNLEIYSTSLTNQIYVPNVHSGGGNQGIYLGPFSFSVANHTVNFASNSLVNTLFKMAGLDVKIDNFAVLCDRVNINGNLKFPDILSTYNNGTLQANVSLVAVIQQQGVDFVANLNMQNVRIARQVVLNHLTIYYDGPNNYFQGSTKLTLPLFSIDGSTEIQNRIINYINLGVTFTQPQPIGTTGISIVSATGSLRHINDPQIPMIIGLGGTFVPTTPGSLSSIANLNLNLEYQLGTYFAANGTVNLFNSSVGNAGFKVWTNRFDAYGNLNLIAVLRAYANFSIWKNPNNVVDLAGQFGGALIMPNPQDIQNTYLRWALSHLFTQGQVLATCDNYLRKQFLTGHAAINHNWFPRVSYLFNWSPGLSFNVGLNYNAIPLSIRQEYGLGQRGNSTTAAGWYGFNLDKSTPEIVVDAQTTAGAIPQFVVVTPEGDSVTNANVASFSNIIYQASAAEGYCYMRFQNPKLGDYDVQLIAADSFHIYRVNTPPAITINTITANAIAKTLTINWNDSDPDDDAKIDLFLDNDMQGGDGIMIAENLSENSTTDSYTFNYGSMKTGHYYVYAMIKDDAGQFHRNYYKTRFILRINSAPNTPTNLAVTQTDSSLRFTYTPTNTITRTNYVLHYAINESLSFTSPNLSIGDTNFYELKHFPKGKTYQFAVSAIDTLERQSLMSNIVTIYHTSATRNDAPTIPKQNINTLAYENTAYTYTLTATDPENNPLTYTLKQAPSGLTINNLGQIQWTPTAAQLGYQVVEAVVSDGMAKDSVLFQIKVMNTQMRQSYIDFSKTLYVNYGETGVVMVNDPDIIAANPYNLDSVMIQLYSNTSATGIMLKAYENAPDSRQFEARFSLNNTVSAGTNLQVTWGDTIFARYIDPSMGTITRNIAFLTRFEVGFLANAAPYCGDSSFFKNTSKGDNLTYAWNFGDGSSSNARSPYHVYANNGTYNVSLNISDPEGRVANSSQLVTINCTIFPVTWLSVNAIPAEKDVKVMWKVAQEQNVKQYDIERSYDAQNFEGIGTKAAIGNATETLSYDYLDKQALMSSNRWFYRIKAIDFDGAVTYSKVVEISTLSASEPLAFSTYPNPWVKDAPLQLVFEQAPNLSLHIELLEVNGKTVFAKDLTPRFGETQFSLDLGTTSLATGVYFLKVSNDKGHRFVQKVTIE
ncbi:MAG: PKD domain-containing protein [Bacteroidia bacterium]